jgi:PAS domain S-box-containing protein
MEHHYSFAYWLILPTGFLLTLILSFYFRAIFGQRVRLERTVFERTAQLQKISEQTFHLNDVLRAIRDVGSLINREKDPLHLLKAVCDSLVQTRGYVMVWIGKSEADSKRVLMVAHSGEGGDFLQHAPITWDDSPTGQGPAGTAMRERRAVVFDDLATDPRFALWKDPVMTYGGASIASVPIIHQERLLGVLTVKANHPHAFAQEEVELLSNLAEDLARALQGLKNEAARNRAEESLRESEAQLRQIIDLVPHMIFVKDWNGKYLLANKAVAEGYNTSVSALTGKYHSDFHADNRQLQLMLQDDREVMTTEEIKFIPEEHYTDTQGNLRFLQTIKVPFLTSGDQKAVLGIAIDITERKRAEQEKERLEAQLVRAQKLEAIGTLAGGIAHDFNNMLVPIIGYTEMALSNIPQFDPMRHGLEQVLNAAIRARDLVKQILAFGRFGEEQQQVAVEISSIVKEALNLLRASLPSSIEIRQNIQAGVALADPTQIHQVLMNLCTNAAHAMDDKGILEVTLSRVDLSKSDLTDWSIVDLKPGPYLKLCVSDTGSGMDAHTIERIFEPYFTTKGVGKGSGLGLAVVHGIVRRHEGAITVQSEPGKGSIFSIYIPAMEADSGVVIETRQELQMGTERILLIDDEQIVVESETAILEQLGYTVTPETNSLRALEIFCFRPNEFDLIITDYTMPKLNGTDLSAAIRRIQPDIPIILCTGFSEKITAALAVDLDVELVMKPFSMKQIAELIRKVLAVQ